MAHGDTIGRRSYRSLRAAAALLLAACDGRVDAADGQLADSGAAVLVAPGDGGDAAADAGAPDSGAASQPCVWGLDELLAEAGVTTPPRSDCGSFNDAETAKISAALDCLLSSADGDAAEFTVNYCIDCSIPSTYVRTPSGDTFHVRMEADQYGDDKREATVERCAGLTKTTGGRIHCVDAEVLYSCQDPFPEGR